MLKNGDYTISSTPCSSKASDGYIDLIFNVGEPISVDVVFEQPATAYRAETYVYMMFYDDTKLTNPACTPNTSYFNDVMDAGWNMPVCTTAPGGAAGSAVDDDGTKIVSNAATNFTANKFPTSKPNFVLANVVFENGYTTPSTNHNSGSEAYTFDFSLNKATVPTDVVLMNADDEQCFLFSTGGSPCAGMGITPVPKTPIKSRIFIDKPSCYVGPPSAATVTSCKASGTCTSTTGDAEADLTIGLPTTCYADDKCSATYTGGTCTPGVEFNKKDGTEVTNYTSTSYKDTTPDVAQSVQYTLTGVDTSGNCNDSSGLKTSSSGGSCTGTTLQSNSLTCKCGDPPTITLTDPVPTAIGDTCSGCKQFLQGTDITVKFSVTDIDGTLPSSITSIKFFYTNDLSVAPQVVNVTDLNSSGVASAKIAKNYVSAEADLYFGVIATDTDGMTGEYPAGFTCSATAPTAACMAANVAKINKNNIILGTRCAFIDGEEPYPNMFPFRATGYSSGSEGNILRIFFALNEVSNVTMRIYSLDGLLVRQVEGSTTNVQPPGQGETCSSEACNFCNWESGCQWDGTTYRGGNDLVANGMYIVNIHAVCTGDNFYGQSVDYTKGIVVMK